ncbi:hypothetical protein JTB14_023438 [Gonioctena quinquepunctata]|nr:hypothetical protein JTB14_023438 [Gonioctena quinquepunctata]
MEHITNRQHPNVSKTCKVVYQLKKTSRHLVKMEKVIFILDCLNLHPNGTILRVPPLTMEYCKVDNRKWDLFLQDSQFALNTARHDSTVFNPSFLVFGRYSESPKALHPINPLAAKSGPEKKEIQLVVFWNSEICSQISPKYFRVVTQVVYESKSDTEKCSYCIHKKDLKLFEPREIRKKERSQKTPLRPSEAENAAGGGDTWNDTINNSVKSSAGSDESQTNRTAQEITNLEEKPKSSQQKASSDGDLKLPDCGEDQISAKDLVEAGPSEGENTDYTSRNTQTDETSYHTDRDMPRGKVEDTQAIERKLCIKRRMNTIKSKRISGLKPENRPIGQY